MAEPTAFGIDLGTTMSVVAQVSTVGLPVVLPNGEGSPTTPSIVLFDAGRAVVGAVAREGPLATEPGFRRPASSNGTSAPAGRSITQA